MHRLRVRVLLMAVLLVGGCDRGADKPAASATRSAPGGALNIVLPAAIPLPHHKAPPAKKPAEAKPAPEPTPKATPAKPAEAKADKLEAKALAPDETVQPAAPAKEKKAAPPAAKAADKSSADTSGKVRLLPARPPLGDAQLAHEIERLKFACGKVTAANRVDDGTPQANPAYKVTCSSGSSYQATDKKGHLFFRAWTGKLARD